MICLAGAGNGGGFGGTNSFSTSGAPALSSSCLIFGSWVVVGGRSVADEDVEVDALPPSDAINVDAVPLNDVAVDVIPVSPRELIELPVVAVSPIGIDALPPGDVGVDAVPPSDAVIDVVAVPSRPIPWCEVPFPPADI